MSKYYATLPVLPKRKYFKIGDAGPEVKLLQVFLNWANYGTKEKALEPDAIYGKLTAKAVSHLEKVHGLKRDGEFGKKCLKVAKSLNMDEAWMAVNWAVSIALDNSFAYGVGDRSHHNGCFYCGTNITGPKHAERGSKWEKTYCCNPFIHAAYAHGAKNMNMLKACEKGHAAGMEVSDWTKYKFKDMGKCSKFDRKKLRHGDVIICKSHVFMVIDSKRFVEASGGGWDEDSIAVKKGLKKRYNAYRKMKSAHVLRYVG